MTFWDDSQITPIPADQVGAVEASDVATSTFSATLTDNWQSLVGIHGGLNAAIVARAITTVIDQPDQPLRSASVQFLSTAEPGRALVTAQPVKTGRSTSFGSGSMMQDDKLIVNVQTIQSKLRDGTDLHQIEPNHQPTPPDTERFIGVGDRVHFMNMDVRLDPRFPLMQAGDNAEIAAWLRPPDGELLDPLWLVMALDFMPPSVFTAVDTWVAGATLDYQVFIGDIDFNIAPDSWLYLHCRARYTTGGLGVEDATLWSPDARVVAVARQVRMFGK